MTAPDCRRPLATGNQTDAYCDGVMLGVVAAIIGHDCVDFAETIVELAIDMGGVPPGVLWAAAVRSPHHCDQVALKRCKPFRGDASYKVRRPNKSERAQAAAHRGDP